MPLPILFDRGVGVLSFMEAIVKTGQRIRLKPSSRAAREWNVPPGAEGTVICRYRILADRPLASDRLDVRFGPQRVVWGAPAIEFEPIAANAQAPK
jgi:hypothetical protein